MSEPEIAAVAAEIEALSLSRPSAQEQRAAPMHAGTRHGGVFVLLKVIDRLGWLERWRQTAATELAQTDADRIARALALEVAARALAPRNARMVVNDPALIPAFDVAGHSLREHQALARHALRATGNRSTALLLDALAGRIAGLAGSSPAYLRKNALALHATLERDGQCVSVVLGRAPLDVLLTLSGAKRGSVTLPGGPRIEMREAAR
jgi:hypothetical protein